VKGCFRSWSITSNWYPSCSVAGAMTRNVLAVKADSDDLVAAVAADRPDEWYIVPVFRGFLIC
jgi:hypothetical protein